MAYENFKLAIYCPAGFLKNVEFEALKKRFGILPKIFRHLKGIP